jgi:hypothetical protein
MRGKKVVEPVIVPVKAKVYPHVPVGKLSVIRKEIKQAKDNATCHENAACNYQPPGL